MTDPENGATARLTPGMKRVLWGAAGVVVIALAAAAWFATAGSDTSTPPPTATASATPGPVPGAEPTSGSEVQSPEDSPPSADRIPDLAPSGPLVSAPLPSSGSRADGLVDGFPSSIVGPLDESEVLSSAIASEGSAMQATLVARTDASSADVLAGYRTLWSGLGLVEQSSGDPQVLTFAGRSATVTLAFSADSATGTVYNILGSFRTE
ncbi:hypothetical protein [Microbacterium sp. CGR1]|uniref:hypothetical protein n=1 Tax=Microbacterium sp. CGR1 TaxID=1696072 RepID=UPI003DA6BD5B